MILERQTFNESCVNETLNNMLAQPIEMKGT